MRLKNSRTDTCFNAAIRCLSRKSYSEQELRKKMLLAGYVAVDIDATIEKLNEYGYLNDIELSKRKFEQYLSKQQYSVRYIINKLRMRGLTTDGLKEEIKAARQNEYDVALLIVEKKNFNLGNERDKILRFLAGKGFSSEIILKIFDGALNIDDS